MRESGKRCAVRRVSSGAAICSGLVLGVAMASGSLLAQTAVAPASGPVAATRTAPPAGFTKMIELWPGGAPMAHGTTEGDVPKLFTYPATAVASAAVGGAAAGMGAGTNAGATGGVGSGGKSAVIVMPGGGYTHLVMEQEGAYEARWMAAHGVEAFVLEYRLAPAYKYPAAMLDGARAVRYVRAHAAEMGIDPAKIGIWGFSAGGHLAGYLATIHDAGDASAKDAVDRMSDRPDFTILSYARLDMNVPVAGGAKPMEQILQEQTQAAVDAIDPVKHVTADTSPCFIYSTTGDQTVDSRNASDFYTALKGAGVKAEMHIFELGVHGTHMGEGLAPAMHELTVTPTLIANWMQLHGWMAAQ